MWLSNWTPISGSEAMTEEHGRPCSALCSTNLLLCCAADPRIYATLGLEAGAAKHDTVVRMHQLELDNERRPPGLLATGTARRRCAAPAAWRPSRPSSPAGPT